MEQWGRQEWERLGWTDKEQALRALQDRLPAGFAFMRMERFERYGRIVETGIFEYKGCEFVLIPGDQVTLGWADWSAGPDDVTLMDMQEGMEEAGRVPEELAKLLREQMSPVREAEIRPLLIERRTRPAGWYEVTLEELDPEEDEDVLEELESFKQTTYSTYEQYQSFRLIRAGESIRVELFDSSDSYEEWAASELEEGFGILTEEEWEYVYGGGCRTLFPWGDSFDYSMKVRHFGELDRQVDEGKSSEDSRSLEQGGGSGSSDLSDPQERRQGEDRPYDLEQPNAFGLYFLGDPYQTELTATADGVVICKGGDGGSSICGGLGVALGYLPVAVYYRDPYAEELTWEDKLDHMHYRRVVRL
ncbi:hypothetical protein [Paenibacillus sp. SYP-B4298]|uniref:hypothetical protein n=1 Tax=Paenibacillus sp. SYP-B4298 TaxID=2996034 RepID=UPI0022DE723D|nr:hypothetical protein [Paenibacillus sp. SYP-B4298]